MTVIGDAHLKHGFTLDRVDHLARAAVGQAFTPDGSSSYPDRHDTAWLAIVEVLYSSDKRPNPRDLIAVGWKAIRDDWRQDLRSKGLLSHEMSRRTEPGARFVKYWDQTGVDHFPEDRILERMALVQVLPLLSEDECETVLAVAAHGTATAAAKALGLSRITVDRRLRAARDVFIAWWHEHETPPPYTRRVPDRRPNTRLAAA